MNKTFLKLATYLVLAFSMFAIPTAFAEDAPPSIGDVTFDEEPTVTEDAPPSLEAAPPAEETTPTETTPTETTPTTTTTTESTTPAAPSTPSTGPAAALYPIIAVSVIGFRKFLRK